MFSRILATLRHAVPRTSPVRERDANSKTRPATMIWTLHRDHRLDVLTVPVTQLGEHLVVDGVEFLGELLQFLFPEVGAEDSRWRRQC